MAVAWDEEWARREARQWVKWANARLPGGDWNEGDVYGTIALIWTEVRCGLRGRFSPRQGAGSVGQQMRGYVIQCVKNELTSQRGTSANRSGINVGRLSRLDGENLLAAREAMRAPEPFSVQDDELARDGLDPSPTGLSLADMLLGQASEAEWADDPAEQLMREQEYRSCATRTRLIDEMQTAIWEAEQMSRRDAACMRVKLPNGRINSGWLAVRVLSAIDDAETSRLAPIMHARWMRGFGASIRGLAGVSQAIAQGVPLLEAVRAEARNLLVLIARMAGEAQVCRGHLDLVAGDAEVAMRDWRGKRGSYKRRPDADAARDPQTREEPAPLAGRFESGIKPSDLAMLVAA